MIYSMTGFAARQCDTEFGLLTVELRTLNHRYLELAVRLPEELRSLETRLRDLVAAQVRRGKVDLSVRFRPRSGSFTGDLRLNHEFARHLAALAGEASDLFPDARPSELASWLAWPGVVEEIATDTSPLQNALLETAEETLLELVAYRRREGEKLASAVRERLVEIETIAERFRKWLPEIRERQRERLREKVATLIDAPVDEQRFEQEVAYLLQRLDVDEELDRLNAHVGEVDRTLNLDKPVGRRLDFLMQELNREANTLGSKSADSRTSREAVTLKVLIEQMREQVQNIE